MSGDVSGLTIFLAIVAPLIGFFGVMVGQLGSRSREIRDMRRRAYVDWLTAAQNLPLTSEQPLEVAEVVLGLTPIEMVKRLNDMQAELAVVASHRVLESARAFIAVVEGDSYGSAMSHAKPGDVRKRIQLHIEMTTTARRAVVEPMRQDMLPWWRWKSRAYTPRRDTE